jgi:MOSC domain-containing protein YiiM
MKLLSIQVGTAREVPKGSTTVLTGIRKLPVDSVLIRELGLEGDTIANTKGHGGLDQAVYVYSQEDYDWWESHLGQQLSPGKFGENLVFDTFGEDVMVGDRFSFGAVVIEATAPRIPCWALANEMEKGDMVREFRASGRPGFYSRVIQEGRTAAGDSIVRTGGGFDVSINELFGMRYRTEITAEEVERVLGSPLAQRMREYYEGRI